MFAAVVTVALILVLVTTAPCSGQSFGDLRLWRDEGADQDNTYGRLQIYVGGKWGEVCDDGFGDTEAEVACHQLQFPRSINEGEESSGQLEIDNNDTDLLPISLSDVYCPTSDYLHLLRCSFQLGQHSCTGKGYTMLQCNPVEFDTPTSPGTDTPTHTPTITDTPTRPTSSINNNGTDDGDPDNNDNDNDSDHHFGEILTISISVVAMSVAVTIIIVIVYTAVNKRKKVTMGPPKPFTVAESGWGYTSLPTQELEISDEDQTDGHTFRSFKRPRHKY